MKEFKAYIKEKGYTDLDVLVAFSGTVTDDDKEYTEVEYERNERWRTD